MNEFLSLHDYVGARRRCYDVCATYDRLLGDDTVLITPVSNAESWAPEGPLPDDGRRHHRPGDLREHDRVQHDRTPRRRRPAWAATASACRSGCRSWRRVGETAWHSPSPRSSSRRRPWPLVADGYDPFPVP